MLSEEFTERTWLQTFQISCEVLKFLMKALLVEHGKGNHKQGTQEVRMIEADNIFAKGLYDL